MATKAPASKASGKASGGKKANALQQPLKPSEELAAVVSWLLGPDSSFVTGQTINVDGGWVME